MSAILKPQSYACRCSNAKCQSRRRLPKHPSQYVRKSAILCRSCSKGHYRVDPYRSDGREQRGHTCRCDNYSYPHYRGRGYCRFNPKLTPEMMQEREQSGVWS